ncbi:MAG: hypothetical protein DMG06_08530 [Acidobacteria bacterium]|nr:MAG: hypothetical protein DMG06_08530 [Acidobacteriota bacterium]
MAVFLAVLAFEDIFAFFAIGLAFLATRLPAASFAVFAALDARLAFGLAFAWEVATLFFGFARVAGAGLGKTSAGTGAAGACMGRAAGASAAVALASVVSLALSGVPAGFSVSSIFTLYPP